MTPILIPGHGGKINGVYQTYGKRSPKHMKQLGFNKTYYEGVGNRWIVNRIKEIMDRYEMPYYEVATGPEDMGLQKRVNEINKIYAKDPNVYSLEIHSNAGGGTGVEGYTTVGETASDEICEVFLADLENRFPTLTHRHEKHDSDRDKERNFYVIRNTKSPAILLEWLFMDNSEDLIKLWDYQWIDRFAQQLVKTIGKLQKQ